MPSNASATTIGELMSLLELQYMWLYVTEINTLLMCMSLVIMMLALCKRVSHIMVVGALILTVPQIGMCAWYLITIAVRDDSGTYAVGMGIILYTSAALTTSLIVCVSGKAVRVHMDKFNAKWRVTHAFYDAVAQ